MVFPPTIRQHWKFKQHIFENSLHMEILLHKWNQCWWKYIFGWLSSHSIQTQFKKSVFFCGVVPCIQWLHWCWLRCPSAIFPPTKDGSSTRKISSRSPRWSHWTCQNSRCTEVGHDFFFNSSLIHWMCGDFLVISSLPLQRAKTLHRECRERA